MKVIEAPAVPGSVRLATFDSDGERLLGAMFVADGPGPHPTLLLLHGFPGTERNFDVAHSVRRAGWNVLVFHYRGAWGSNGAFSFGNSLADAAAALDFLRSTAAANRVDTERIAVAGHSMGGFIALMSAARDKSLLGAASWAGFNFGAFAQAIEGDLVQIAGTAGEWHDLLAPLRGTTGTELVAEVLAAGDEWNLSRLAGCFSGRKTLLLAAEKDSVAPPTLHHDPLVQRLRHAGVAVFAQTMPGDHGFTSVRPQLTSALLSWLSSL